MKWTSIRITDSDCFPEEKEEIHIHGASCSAFLTVCGWVDVSHEVLDSSVYPPNCKKCYNIVKEYKKYRLPPLPKEGKR